MTRSLSRAWLRQSFRKALACFPAGSRPRHGRERKRPTLEQLEARVAPAAISWNGNAGDHNWDTPGNWSTNTVPTISDDVTISKSGAGTITIGGASDAARTVNDTTGVLSLLSGSSLSIAAVAASTVFGKNVTVKAGATLAFGANASVQLSAGVTLTDAGTLSFAAGDAVSLAGTFNGGATQLLVSNGGLLTAAGTAFSGGNAAYNSVYLDNGSLLQANGGLSGNSFALPLYIAAGNIQYLSSNGNSNLAFQDIDLLTGSVVSSQTVALNAIGSDTSNLRYVFPANFTVKAGGTLTVGANVSVLLQAGVTLTDAGTLSFAAGDAVSLAGTFNGGATQLLVSNGGLLTAAGTAFSGGNAAYNSVYLDNGSLLQANGGLSGNSFALPLYLAAGNVQYLSGNGNSNVSFQDIDLLTGSIPSGQTVALNAIGSDTSNLRYVFPANFTVKAGGTLTVGANVSVLLQAGVTLTDAGTLSFAAGDAVSLAGTFNGGAAQLLVSNGGLLTAAGTAFSGGNAAYNSVYLDNGSLLQANGGLTGNSFALPLYIAAGNIQYLSGNGNSNLAFQDIDLLAGSIVSGQTVALNAIGSDTSKLRYVFPANFTVKLGGTLTVGANISVLLQAGVTLTDAGTLSFAAGDAVSLAGTFNGGAAQLLVSNGGLLTAAGTAFSGGNAAYNSVYLDNGSLLQANGGLSGNSFALPLYVSVANLPYLSSNGNSNLAFQDIDLLAGSIVSGQTVSLSLIGSDTSNLRYVFPANFTVNAGGTLNVAANVSVLVQAGVTLTDNGTVSFGGGDTVSLAGTSGSSAQLLVSSGGLLTATGTSFSGSHALITVNANGTLSVTSGALAITTVTLNGGSVDTIQYVTVSCQIAIDSGASIAINQNDFSGVPSNGIIANGSSTATIDLSNNYWGADPTKIPGQILDHNDNTSRPTVKYTPYLALRSTQTAAATASDFFSSIAAQNVTLSASVTSPSGTVNEGAVTFTILDNSSNPVGNPVQGNVSNGAVSVTYVLPVNTAVGAYTIQAVYSDGTSGNFNGSSDNGHALTVYAATTTTTASSASATYSVASQTVPLSATVTSGGGSVSPGTVTFSILDSSNKVVGSSVTVNFTSGSVSANYTLPAGTAGGTYTIQATYNGSTSFAPSTDTGHTLTIGAVSTSTAAVSASTTYNPSAHSVSLSASVSSSIGAVGQGTETFTLVDASSNVVGSAVTVNVSGGSAAASYPLPAGAGGGTYTIQAVYSGTSNYTGSSDSSHSLTIGAAATSAGAADASTTYSSLSQTVSLSATVSSSAGTVDEGTETFTVLSGNTAIGNSVTVNVSGGSASASYTLPAGTAQATYTIRVVYSDPADYQGSSDATHSLTINPAPAPVVTVGLEPNSNSGAPDHPGVTNVPKPVFDVQVNQPGTITIDFDGNAAHDQSQTVSAAGTYPFTAPALADGGYTATATFSAGLAGSAQDSMAYTIDTVAPQVTGLSPGGTLHNRVSQATVTFSEPVDLNSLTSGITLTGPTGSIAVNPPQLLTGTTYLISFAPQTVQGTYTLVIASTVTDFAANALKKNASTSFTIGLPDLAVTSTSAPPSAIEGVSFPVAWQVTNGSPSNPTGGTWTDAVYVSAKAVLDNTAVRLTSLAGPASALGPSASYSRSTSVAIPGSLAPGSYYLLFVTDDDGGQAETNTSNDVLAAPVVVTAPDLQVTSVSGPAAGFTGQAVLVSWTDSNIGPVAATGPWVDAVFTASDAQGDNPTVIGNFTFSGTLAAGASVQRTQQVILPQTAGTHWFGVTVNSTRSLAESALANNTAVAASSVTIASVPLPDLVVTGITPPPNGVLSGDSVPVSFVVQNVGKAPTTVPAWKDWVILSQDPNLAQTYQGQLNPTGPGGDQTLNNQPVVLGLTNPTYLGVGESYQQTVNVPLPISAQGVWHVYVVPDGTGYHHGFAMPEASRTDKLAQSAGFSVTLSPPPDLAVSNVKAPAQDFSGQPMKLSWTVTNNGTGPTAAGTWTDTVYMSPHAILDASAIPLASFTHTGALAAGDGYTSSTTVHLPVGLAGSFYFLVQTDANGQVFENGATANNVAATPSAETVNLTPPPDLVVSAISAPATAQAGHALTFSYTVTNAGAGATPNYTWNDALYLSPTPTSQANAAIPLGRQTHQGSLAAGDGYTNSVTVTLPVGLVGPYYLVVVTDSTSAVFELDRTNNTLVSTGAVQMAAAPPDLVVSSTSAPSAVLPGSAIVVRWTVVNQGIGNTAVSSWQDEVYLDTGATLTGNALALGSFTHAGLLAAGGSYTQSQLVTVPINLLGSYHLFVVADSSGDVSESNTANDTSTAVPISIQLQVTDPQGGTQQAAVSDLQVTAVTASPITNNTVTVTWTVQNKGTGPTNATYWDDDVWMSTTPTLQSGGTDVYLGSLQHTNPLAAGASYSASETLSLPQGFASGNYYFIVATNRPVAPPTDDGSEGVDQVYESNPGNNETASANPVPASPAPLPDLTVSSVTAPVTATSGGQLAVGWTVTNGGADTNATITDSVYLSYDQVFDPGSDIYLGSATHSGVLAGGGSYTQNANVPIRSGVAGTFWVFVVTNSNGQTAEQDRTNDAAFGAQSVQIQLAPPADLVAGTVTIPASALAGEDLTLTYQVTNNGGNPANGSWTDALYLSPTPTWDVSDPLLGTVSQTQNLAPGTGYSGTLTAPLPGVAPGSYYVIVRSNIRATLREQTLDNNLSASLTQASIDAPRLTLGTPTQGTLNPGQSAYYKVVVSEGQTLQLSLTGQNPAAYNELYVSFGTLPTRSKYDYRYGQPFTANQQITVPTTQAGAYYILAYGDTVPSAPENYAIEAALIPFSIQTVAPAQAGTGPVTLEISGARFNFGTSFQLRNSSGAVLNATRTLLQDSATAYATFDLTGQAVGAYDVWATQSDGTSTELAAGLSVVPATPNSVQLTLVVPQAVLVGRPGTITVTYTNPGNTDLPAPLLLLDASNALFQVPGLTGFTRSKLQLLGANSSGPFGTLPPGFQGSITVSFEPATAGAGLTSTFTVSTLEDPNQPFDWNAVAANDVPVGTSPQQWAGLVSQAAPHLGSTWGSVVSFLDTHSIQLVKNVAGAVGPAALDGLSNFDGLLQYAVAIYGSANPAPATPSFPVVASQGEVTLYNAHVDSSGNPVPLNASYPTFVIVPGFGGYLASDGTLAQIIAADTDCFPNGQVNILIATWQGATAGPTLDGFTVPWMAALHVETAGTDLGDLLASLNLQGGLAFSTTTIVGEGLGSYVGNQAAKIVGGLEDIIAFNPASALGGYLPPSLKVWFQHSTAYETSSLFDTQLAIAASNQTLPTGDLNNPFLQSTYGVTWLTGQIQDDNCAVLDPTSTTGPDNPPPANDPPPPSDPTGSVVSSADVVQIVPHDPNSIIGPKGPSTNPYVSSAQPLPYTVLFSNVPTVQAPAQQVVIREQMDANLDWRTFRLTGFGFGGQTYAVPANSSFFQTTIDLTQTRGFDVQVTATLDQRTGIATWTFTTVDPQTGQVPLDPTVGLLPPDDASGDGEGFVSYTIKAAAADTTGTVIGAQATILFDTQPPMDTQKISNIVDTGAGLTSSVSPLPPLESANPFTVSWPGSDASNGSGVAGYTIYVSDNGGPYQAWLQNTPLTSAPFLGQGGHSYSFYSVAIDYAGNVQAPPTAAQASTVLDGPPVSTIGTPPAGSGYSTAAWPGTISGSTGDATSGVQQVQVSILDQATGQYWNGSNFASSTEVFTPATLASPGATSTTWSITFPSSNFPADGSYVVHVLATDGAGTVEVSGPSASFSYDNVAPATIASVSGTQGANGWYTSPSVSVTLSGSDPSPGSGLAAVYYAVDDNSPGAFQRYSGAVPVTHDGKHTVYFYSVDNAGNQEATQSSPVWIDSTGPVLTPPPNQILAATARGKALVNYQGATATDNLGTATVSYSQASGTDFPLGTTMVQVTATDAAGNQAVGSFTVTVVVRADHLVVVNPPAQVIAGGRFALSVYAEDPFTNLDTGLSGSVVLSPLSGPTGGKLAGVLMQPIQNGVATFSNLSLGGPGSYTILAGSSLGLVAATVSVPVVPAPQFKVTLSPATPGQTDSGQPFNVTVTVLLGGKTDTGYLGIVQLTSSDPQVAPVVYTFQNADKGSKTLSLTLRTIGQQTVSVADASLPSASGKSNAVTVTSKLPLTIDHFLVTGFPNPDISGVVHTITITAVNAAGQTVTGYTGPITIASTDPSFRPVVIQFGPANKGVLHATVVLTTPGVQSLTATDGGGKTGSQSNLLVVSPATHLTLTGAPAKVTAGNQVLVTVTGRTASNAPDTLFADTLQLTTSDPRAVVVAQPMANGAQTFAVTFRTAGTQTITVTDLTRPAITGPALSIGVSAAAAAQLVVTGVPLFALKGTSASFSVTAVDLDGNPVLSGFTDTVSVAGQSYPFKPTDHGTHRFSILLSAAAGTEVLTAADSTLNGNVSSSPRETITVLDASPAIVADPADGTETALVVLAPPTGGTILITPANAAGTDVTVTVNGKPTSATPYSPTGHIYVYGQGGNDVIKVVADGQGDTVAIPAILFAGTGADALSVAGSRAGNVLVGGPGADSLTGGSGPDVLIGGSGKSTLHAGSGGDILIGGRTAWDANVAALAAVLAEWSRPDRDFQTRVQDLSGDGSGGLNGSYLLAARSVVLDTAIAQLFGGNGGDDWFWLAAGLKSANRIGGYADGDVVTFE